MLLRYKVNHQRVPNDLMKLGLCLSRKITAREGEVGGEEGVAGAVEGKTKILYGSLVSRYRFVFRKAEMYMVRSLENVCILNTYKIDQVTCPSGFPHHCQHRECFVWTVDYGVDQHRH